jgi:predicted PurR-regulated permease PerM
MLKEHNKKVWFWLGIGLAFCLFIYSISSILLPFVLGMLIAYFLDPAADWLETKKFSRTAATATLIIGFFATLLLGLLALSPVLYDQFMGLMRSLPGYIEDAQRFVGPQLDRVLTTITTPENAGDAKEAAAKASGTLFDVAQNFVKGLFASGMALVNMVALLTLTPVVAFYLLRDYDHIVAEADRLLPRDNAATIREQVRLIDDTISGYLRGQVNVCLLLALFYAIGLSLAGLKYGIIVGLISGLIAFIPYVGALLGFVVAILIAIFQFDELLQIAIVAGIYGLGQFIEGNILVPKLVGEKVGLHPAWVIFGMLAGGALLGFVGVLLAVPITAIIGVLARFAVLRYRQSTMYQGDDEYEAPNKKGKPLTRKAAPKAKPAAAKKPRKKPAT